MANRIIRFPGKMVVPSGWPRLLAATIADDFERPNSTSLGNTPVGAKPWTVSAGISIIDGTMNCATGAVATANFPTGVNNFEVEARYATIGSTAATLGGGLVAGSGYWLSTRLSSTSIGVGFYGSTGLVGATSTIQVRTGDVVSIRLVGSVLTGYVNGQVAAQVTDATFTDNTARQRAGFFSNSGTAARLDYIQVRPL